jgi:hypothetical protein
MADYQQIHEFASQFRNINGLYLFKIFSKYTQIPDIERLFNFLAQRESEDDLRTLERLWRLFIKTGSISEFKVREEKE